MGAATFKEVIQGFSQDAKVTGSGGVDDVLDGGSGNDLIVGRGGDDFLRGLDGDDMILGGQGNDSVRGNKGNDIVIGGKGDDEVRGGQGEDYVEGGYGADTLRGDTETAPGFADTFVFRDYSAGFDGNGGAAIDTIEDFEAGLDSILFDGDFVEAYAVQSGADANIWVSTGGSYYQVAVVLGANEADVEAAFVGVALAPEV